MLTKKLQVTIWSHFPYPISKLSIFPVSFSDSASQLLYLKFVFSASPFCTCLPIMCFIHTALRELLPPLEQIWWSYLPDSPVCLQANVSVTWLFPTFIFLSLSGSWNFSSALRVYFLDDTESFSIVSAFP